MRSKFQYAFFLLLFRELLLACMYLYPSPTAEHSIVDSFEHVLKAVSEDKRFAKLPRMQMLRLIYFHLCCLLVCTSSAWL